MSTEPEAPLPVHRFAKAVLEALAQSIGGVVEVHAGLELRPSAHLNIESGGRKMHVWLTDHPEPLGRQYFPPANVDLAYFDSGEDTRGSAKALAAWIAAMVLGWRRPGSGPRREEADSIRGDSS